MMGKDGMLSLESYPNDVGMARLSLPIVGLAGINAVIESGGVTFQKRPGYDVSRRSILSGTRVSQCGNRHSGDT